MTSEAYNAWSLLLQVLIWVAMLATFYVYRRQLQAMERGALGQNMLSVANLLQATPFRDAREVVLKQLLSKPFPSWAEDDRRIAALVCSTYDIASLLILEQQLVPAQPFLTTWGRSIVRCYEICRPYIAEMELPQNGGPGFWRHFTRLYHAAKSAAQQRGVYPQPRTREGGTTDES